MRAQRPASEGATAVRGGGERPLSLTVLVSGDTDWVLRRRAEILSLGHRCAWRSWGDPAVLVRDASFLWLDLRTPGVLDRLDDLRVHTDAGVVCFAPADDQKLAIEILQRGADRVLPLQCDSAHVLAVMSELQHARGRRPERIIGRIVLVESAARVYVDRKLLTLTPVEYRLLDVLSRRPGTVVEGDRLAREALDLASQGSRALSVHLSNLRRKLGPAADHIRTLRGSGYLLQEPDSCEVDPRPPSVVETTLHALGAKSDAPRVARAALSALLGIRRSLMVSGLVETLSRITPPQIEELRRLLARLDAHKESPELYVDAELDLFSFVASIAGRPALMRVVEEAAQRLPRSPWFQTLTMKTSGHALSTYQAILQWLVGAPDSPRAGVEALLARLDTEILNTACDAGVYGGELEVW